MTTNDQASRRIACWSGPRNISTAMLRSWGSRSDAYVTDEPLYAHYLLSHGLDHPGREEIMEHHDTNAQRVVDWLVGEVPEGKQLWYQKHMAHHLLDDVPRAWLDQVDHAFLIRDPKDMITSFIQVVPHMTLEETGLPQQVEIFERCKRRTGRTPPVCDARDILDDPRGVLSKLCAALDVEWTNAMLSWAPGPRETDGIWAPHWYGSVNESTAFTPYHAKDIDVPEPMEEVLAGARALYDRLAEQKIC